MLLELLGELLPELALARETTTVKAPDRNLRPLGLHHSPRRGGEISRRNVSPIRVLPKLVDLPHMLTECRLHLGCRGTQLAAAFVVVLQGVDRLLNQR